MTASDHLGQQFHDYNLTAQTGVVNASHPHDADSDGLVGQLLWDPDEGQVTNVHVSERHQRKGLASAMLDLARTHAAANGLPSVQHDDAESQTPEGAKWAKAKP